MSRFQSVAAPPGGAEQEVEQEQHEAPRRQKTPPPGVRPGVLAEPGPQRSDRTVRHSSGASPSLALPVLAATASEVVDSSALRAVTALAVDDQKKQEEAAKWRRSGWRCAWRRRTQMAGNAPSAAMVSSATTGTVARVGVDAFCLRLEEEEEEEEEEDQEVGFFFSCPSSYLYDPLFTAPRLTLRAPCFWQSLVRCLGVA